MEIFDIILRRVKKAWENKVFVKFPDLHDVLEVEE